MKIVALCVFALFARIAHAQPSSAAISAVAKSRTWHRLLHYNSKSGTSDIVNPAFFYSSVGPKDPQAELVADLHVIENESADTSEENRFACRFPARRLFIQKTFGLSTKLDCPSYNEWQARYAPDSVSFIYAAQFVGNPASAFGHSFLRFDHADHSGLLGLSLSYFAKTTVHDNPIVYAYKGLFGGYTGVFEFDSYYPKTHGYSSGENRNIWEYTLNLKPEERLFLFAHAREMSIAGQKKYFFLDRNCTFQLLQLLDVANENLQLAEKGDRFFLTPQDSVKILADAGLISDVSFRPSLRQKAATYFSSIDSEQKEKLSQVLDGRLAPERLDNPLTASALVATLAMNEVSETVTPEQQQMFSRAAKARAQLPTVTSPLLQMNLENAKKNPLSGHDTYQAHLGFVQSSIEIGFRPAVHAINDYEVGFLPNSQLVILETNVRIKNETSKTRAKLQDLNLIDVKSLPAYSLINHQASWTTQLSYRPVVGSDCNDCHALRAAAAVGYSADLAARTLGYALIGPTVDAMRPGGAVEARIGPTLSTGLISRQFKQIVLKLEERFDYFLSGPFDQERLLTSELSATWLINKNSSVSVTGSRVENFRFKEFNQFEAGLRFSQNF